MNDLSELLEQKHAIDRRIEELREAERAQAVEKCQAMIQTYGLTERDLFGKAPATRKAAPAPRYRNPLTGETWSGRGRAPRWMDGDRAAFAI